jgi:hypothetical protein
MRATDSDRLTAVEPTLTWVIGKDTSGLRSDAIRW